MDVFISHSSKDKEIADKVCEHLEAKGISCRIAPRDIVAGTDRAASITSALTESKVFLIIYTENSSSSEQVAREMDRFYCQNRRKHVDILCRESLLTTSLRCRLKERMDARHIERHRRLVVNKTVE